MISFSASAGGIKQLNLNSNDINYLIDHYFRENNKEPKNENLESEVMNLETNFLEIKTDLNERGKGCEAMNKCSGKGTCSNGTCLCDEGFDYFDCSVSNDDGCK
jgi:hypothetical protein